MQKVIVAVVIAAALQTAGPHAQTSNTVPPAGPVTLEGVAKALGASTRLTSLQFSATGANYAYGQAWKADMPWPAFKIFSYTATFDYATPAMRIDLQRTNPDTTPVRGGGGLPLLAPQQQIQCVSGQAAWNLATPAGGGAPVATPAPAAVGDRLLTLWTLTPQGVIKAAMANHATIAGRVISFKIGDTPVRATVGPNNLITSVRTTGDAAVLGDTVTETTFSGYDDYRGAKFPTHIVQRQGGFPILDLTVSAVRPQSNVLVDVPAAAQAAAPVPAAVRVDTQKVADGVYYLTGGSHHSVAVEFKDYVVVIEAPQTDERAVAVFEAVQKAIPGKPIRYVVNTHNHFDHLGGIRAAIADGYTIVTQASNKPYYTRVATMPHTVSPDRLGKAWPKKVVIEGVFDKRVFTDDMNTLELYKLSTDHNDAMLVAYLPKAKLLVEADLWNPPAANAPPAPAVNPVTVQLVEGVKTLNLDVQQIAGLHGRLATIQELRSAAGM
jgi:glyoxylase-like metal-dependent hydrolase (beta-lactamase superfamily II)